MGRKPELLSMGDASRWRSFETSASAGGYASYYYCDELAQLPVRAITKIKDNKSDPNLETGTYGLFSTCEQGMRSGIVRNQPQYLFFVTKPRKQARHLTGMYELGWYRPGSFAARERDFALAAKAVRFITPVALKDLPGDLGEAMSGTWRLVKRLDSEQTEVLASLVNTLPDRTGEYLAEIERMEQINRYHSTFSYPVWRRSTGWTWDDAEHYLRAADLTVAGEVVGNSSPSDWWRCNACNKPSEGRALLKSCPHCGALATLRPLAVAPDISEIEAAA